MISATGDGRTHRVGLGADAALSYRTYTGEADLRRAKFRVLSHARGLILKLRRGAERPSRTTFGVPTSSQFPSEIDVLASSDERELRKYPPSLTKSLYEVFHSNDYLPCHCTHRITKIGLCDDHVCVLQLDERWEVPGDRTHSYFLSAITRSQEPGHRWTRFRFELPSVDTPNGGFSHSHQVRKSIRSGQHEKRLVDVCKFLLPEPRYPDCEIPIRIEHDMSGLAAFTRLPDTPNNIFLEPCAPIPLRTLLEDDCLTARSKVSLAFTLSKSLWQYYDSDWMKVRWDPESIKILRQVKGTDSSFDHECRTPFLDVSQPTAMYCEYETQMGTDDDLELHPYPYILTLGILLVQICLRATPTNDMGPRKRVSNNDIYMYYYREINKKESIWPILDLHDEYKKMYREIVAHCLPSRQNGLTGPLFSATLDAADRRNLLMKHVVQPLHDLLNYTSGLATDATTGTTSLKNHESTAGVMNMIRRSQSERAGEWLECLRRSPLLLRVSKILSNPNSSFKRPKIAIIDTGYDPNASGLTHGMRKSLSPNHWEDCWGKEPNPCDYDGHGTSMLSLICDAAPFAEIFVARIARTSRDLSENPVITSENLAKAIHWAVNENRVDVVSMSLGWEKEPFSRDRRPVISNAILEALNSQDQKVLFFAATSNDGSRSHEFFPAKHEHVFSIRATDANGYHQGPNAALPESGEVVFGTLGIEVPTASILKTPRIVLRNGASPATAIAAALAALVIGYTTINEPCGVWDDIRTHRGFQQFLYKVTNTSESRKRFFTLEEFYMESHWPNLNHHLGIASWGQNSHVEV